MIARSRWLCQACARWVPAHGGFAGLASGGCSSVALFAGFTRFRTSMQFFGEVRNAARNRDTHVSLEWRFVASFAPCEKALLLTARKSCNIGGALVLTAPQTCIGTASCILIRPKNCNIVMCMPGGGARWWWGPRGLLRASRRRYSPASRWYSRT